MGVEFLLLFGLGIMGVVLTNLLTGDTATEARPSVGGSSAALDAAARAVETAPTTTTDAEQEATTGTPSADAVADDDEAAAFPTAPHEPPHLWGHPAPLARLLALVVVSAVLLCSVVWGLGWLAAQAIARAVGG